MKSKYSARLKTYTIALAYLNENEAITKEVDEIAPLYKEAVTILEKIADADDRKTQKIGGVSIGKKQHQNKLTEQALAIAKVISSYAAKNNNPELMEAMNFSRTELFYGRDQQLSTKSGIILTQARELAGELTRFGITPEKIEKFAGAIDLYKDILVKPRVAIQQRKEASMELDTLFRRLQLLFLQQLDPLIHSLKENHPVFYDTYLERRRMVNAAHRKTRVEGLIVGKETREPLAGVDILPVGVDMEPASSDEKGNYSLQTPLFKRLPVQFRKKGYKSVSVETTVTRGKVTIVNVEMEKEDS